MTTRREAREADYETRRRELFRECIAAAKGELPRVRKSASAGRASGSVWAAVYRHERRTDTLSWETNRNLGRWGIEALDRSSGYRS